MDLGGELGSAQLTQRRGRAVTHDEHAAGAVVVSGGCYRYGLLRDQRGAKFRSRPPPPRRCCRPSPSCPLPAARWPPNSAPPPRRPPPPQGRRRAGFAGCGREDSMRPAGVARRPLLVQPGPPHVRGRSHRRTAKHPFARAAASSPPLAAREDNTDRVRQRIHYRDAAAAEVISGAAGPLPGSFRRVRGCRGRLLRNLVVASTSRRPPESPDAALQQEVERETRKCELLVGLLDLQCDHFVVGMDGKHLPQRDQSVLDNSDVVRVWLGRVKRLGYDSNLHSH